MTRPKSSRVLILNTLGAALAHYTSELEHDLRAAGCECDVVEILEPSRGGGSSMSWLLSYLRALVDARRHGGRVIITWPLLGFVDLLIVQMFLGSRGWVVVHDPRPLVEARGYGRFSQWLSARLARAPFIVHSQQGFDAIDNLRLRSRARIVAHPMLPPARKTDHRGGQPVVRVLGQYKPDRDVDALQAISSSLADPDFEVVGRKWPAIPGWSVRAEFVPEPELIELMQTSSAVVIPYRRFYQSGVAIRCLELGTAVVGPAGTSMDDLLGAASGLLARDSWAKAVQFALTDEGNAEAGQAADAWYAKGCAEWQAWAAEGNWL